MIRSKRWICGTVLVLGMATGAHAQQKYPVKPIRLITAFAPGGGSDILARIIAPQVSEALGKLPNDAKLTATQKMLTDELNGMEANSTGLQTKVTELAAALTAAGRSNPSHRRFASALAEVKRGRRAARKGKVPAGCRTAI